MHVRGNKTLGENIADAGGIKVSQRARSCVCVRESDPPPRACVYDARREHRRRRRHQGATTRARALGVCARARNVCVCARARE